MYCPDEKPPTKPTEAVASAEDLMAAAEEMMTGSKEVWRHVASRKPRFKSEAYQPAWYNIGRESLFVTTILFCRCLKRNRNRNQEDQRSGNTNLRFWLKGTWIIPPWWVKMCVKRNWQMTDVDCYCRFVKSVLKTIQFSSRSFSEKCKEAYN